MPVDSDELLTTIKILIVKNLSCGPACSKQKVADFNEFDLQQQQLFG